MAQSLSQPRFRPPWLTTLLCCTAVLLFWVPPSLSSVLAFERASLLQGQVWRLWTGHLLHFGPGHLLWDLLVVALAGCWLEQLSRRLLVAVLMTAPAVISLSLLLLCPDLVRYGGLSGVAVALLAALVVTKLIRTRSLPWLLLLLAVAAKVALEFLSGDSLLGVFADGNVLNVPLAHLLGLLTGSALACMYIRRSAG